MGANQLRRDVFQAIADPTRREIIDLLANQSSTINKISDHFSISRPAISKHMRILRECGVIRMEIKGRERVCSLENKALKEIEDWLEPYRNLWVDRYDQLDKYLKKNRRLKI